MIINAESGIQRGRRDVTCWAMRIGPHVQLVLESPQDDDRRRIATLQMSFSEALLLAGQLLHQAGHIACLVVPKDTPTGETSGV